MLWSDIESLDLAIGRPGVFGIAGMDFSDVGGEGGVNASDTSDDADFVGGVAIVGEELDVLGRARIVLIVAVQYLP